MDKGKDYGVRELRARSGLTQSEFAARYGIPFRTLQRWEAEGAAAYVVRLLRRAVDQDYPGR